MQEVEQRRSSCRDHPLRHAPKELEGSDVRIKYHLLAFPRVGHHEHLPAVSQAEVGHLDGLYHPTQFHLFVAPDCMDAGGRATQEQLPESNWPVSPAGKDKGTKACVTAGRLNRCPFQRLTKRCTES